MFEDGLNNEFEKAHDKGLRRGFDLGWSYKGRFDRTIIEDMIKTLDKQCEKCPRSGGRLKILAQKDILRQILKEIKDHPNNRENITFGSW
ncbi:MAG: hypothetical protein CMO74_13955 [Verrucomicrobiales bacterium]|nr:hypothetical protein [Verrucomicrobiales bacterium]|tara:strand:+ start:56963 stop:57232 length:270 start_codon:yes stop_codon:yes gene_type:complete